MTMILDPAVSSFTEYLLLKKQISEGSAEYGDSRARKHKLLVPARPDVCPRCGCADSFWIKGYYFRWAVEGEIETVIPVPRYKCRRCSLVVSVLYAFLVPYCQFTKQAIASGVESYLLTDETYRESAAAIAGDNEEQRPDHSQVWRWVDKLVTQAAQKLTAVLQRACMIAGKEDQLSDVHQHVCRNAIRAQSIEKAAKLTSGARMLILATIFLSLKQNFVAAVQTYFAFFVQPPSSILTGRGITLITPQSSQQVIF
jgi:hypothetical protein